MAIRKSKVNVKPYTYRKNGKTIKVKGHTKTVKRVVDVVSKKQYRATADKKSKSALQRDMSRTKRDSVSKYASKKALPVNWNTDKTDWIGVDAKGYTNIPANSKTLKGGYSGYTIKKWTTKPGVIRYQCRYNNKPIGPTTPISKLQYARMICKIHHGRKTGTITNKKWDDIYKKLTHQAKNPYRLKDDPNYDDAYDDSSDWYDSSITRSENIREGKERMSFRNQSIHW